MSSLSRKFELGHFQASSTYSGSKICSGTRLEEPVKTYIRSQIKVAFDWEIRFRILKSNAKSAYPENGFHLREIRSLGGFQLGNPNPDFIDFLFTVRLGNSKKDSQNCFREQRSSFC